ncbi:MAG: hypothetical protein HY566_01405 [Candidatus Kerfeldbacteria bacterium]|nr:hypothetical protein [Candidatus Kerfeldbacteria bacterium]
MNGRPSIPSSTKDPRTVVGVSALLAVIALLVWARIYSGAQKPATNSETRNGNTQSATPGNTTQYTDAEFGFSLTHPSDWKVERNSTGEGENRIVNIVMGDGSQGVTIVIIPVALEGVVRESISITEENETTVNGKQATRIQARTAKDGSPLDLLLFRNGGMLIDLNGPADLVSEVGSTMTFEETK